MAGKAGRYWQVEYTTIPDEVSDAKRKVSTMLSLRIFLVQTPSTSAILPLPTRHDIVVIHCLHPSLHEHDLPALVCN